jgi:hypothetical protein
MIKYGRKYMFSYCVNERGEGNNYTRYENVVHL